jgi:magnesium transporter
MKSDFKLVNGCVVPAVDEPAVVSLYMTPDNDEKQSIIDTLSLDAYDLESALDVDEIARAEFPGDLVSIIWKQPNNVSVGEQLRFDVSSMGLFLRRDELTVIVREDSFSFMDREFQHTDSATDVLLKLLLHTVRHYLGHLKVIKQLTTELGSKITGTMDNHYLLQMLALAESLIYYINAIEANGGVLAKLQSRSPILGWNPQQLDLLHDITVENQQCARQARIYSDVVSGLMDARGTIINNNVNVLLKNLTLINIIFLPLNLLAGIGGMSEFSMMTHSIDWRISYALFCLSMAVMGWGGWHLLVRVVEKRSMRNR